MDTRDRTNHEYSNRRRSQRVVMRIPVTVSGEAPWGSFNEETHTLVINAHGALITLAARVLTGQKVELESPTHPEARLCNVVWQGVTEEGKTQYGIAFLQPSPNFWRIAFPSEVWMPASERESAPAKKG